MLEQCLCGSNESYAHCCAPYHTAEKTAETAEKLMRSRYCAYVKHHIGYIVATTLPAQQKLLDQTAMQTWSEETQWVKLEILNFYPKVSKIHAQVEFKAYFQDGVQLSLHHELSAFTFIDGQWYFLDPTIEMHTSMKHPCICGSGKKFKHCCGVFLG